MHARRVELLVGLIREEFAIPVFWDPVDLPVGENADWYATALHQCCTALVSGIHHIRKRRAQGLSDTILRSACATDLKRLCLIAELIRKRDYLGTIKTEQTTTTAADPH